jgi:hypothetical protein
MTRHNKIRQDKKRRKGTQTQDKADTREDKRGSEQKLQTKKRWSCVCCVLVLSCLAYSLSERPCLVFASVFLLSCRFRLSISLAFIPPPPFPSLYPLSTHASVSQRHCLVVCVHKKKKDLDKKKTEQKN